MSGNVSRSLSVLTVLATLVSAQSARAQWYPGSNPCECVQPVTQPVYQTVPVTELQQVTRTVEVPHVETEWVDEEVTAYREVVEPRTVEVPTVAYQSVTECQTVQQNAGFWTTRLEHRPKVAPCQYDNRPGVMGWLNRTGYSIRSAFTPTVKAHREYVPQTVTRAIPVTRQVAIPSTRQVTYNVSKMVPYTTTRKVARNRVTMVKRDVIEQRPVTVMRTVPAGARTTFLSTPLYGVPAARTVLAPTSDPISSARRKTPEKTARRPEDDQKKSDPYEENVAPFDSSSTAPHSTDKPIRNAAHDDDVPSYPEALAGFRVQRTPRKPATEQLAESPKPIPSSVPSAVRVAGWKARTARPADNGPLLLPQPVNVADRR